MEELKLKKRKYRQLDDIATETAKEVNGLAKETLSKMWEIGKILVKKREETDPKFKGAFYAAVANKMQEDMSIDMLYQCARFYERYPDFETRVSKTGLSGSHYLELARVGDRERAEELEIMASEGDWSKRRLIEEIRPPTPDVPDYEQDYHNVQSSLTDFDSGLERIVENLDKLSQIQKNDLARSIFVLITSTFPIVLRELEKSGAEIDDNFVKLIKKIRGS